MILLLPYKETARSLELLDGRVADDDTRELNRTFVTALSNYRAADIIIYTEGHDALSVAAVVAREAAGGRAGREHDGKGGE